jgi:hypothetical protein
LCYYLYWEYQLRHKELLVNKPYLQKLDHIGTAWVRECLENGEAFSKIVLSEVSLDKGAVYLAVATPEHEEAAKGNRPLKWGALSSEVISTNQQAGLLLDELRRLKAEYDSLAIVVEDNLMQPGHPLLKFPDTRLYQIKNRYLHSKNLSAIHGAADLDKHLSQSSGYPLDAFIIAERSLPENEIIDEGDAESMASSVLGIINFAYDNETYTLWLKEGIGLEDIEHII